MKKFILFTCTLTIFFTSVLFAQKNNDKNNTIHHISIFKIINNGSKKKNFIRIDANGNFEQIKAEKESKGVLKNHLLFFKEIGSLIDAKQLEYVEPSNNPPREASMPNLKEQSIYFTIVTNEEIIKSKEFNTGSYYSWGKSNIDINIPDYSILDKVNGKTKKQLLKLLQNQ